jgi:hypothetical protein
MNSWREAGVANGKAPVAPSNADAPQLAVDGRGTLYSLWCDDDGGGWWSASANGGATWSQPQRWAKAGVDVEKFSVVRLADGRVLAAWLQAPAKSTAAASTALVSRIVGIADQPDQLIDPRVCDCCPIGLAPFLDGGTLIAYRGRSDEEVRDIHVARWRYGRWSEPRLLSNDDWRVAACPVNGPRVGTDGSRVAAAWFTGAGGEPRVLASYSPDAGTRWLMPLRVDRGHPLGHVETVFLRDGAFLVFWLEADGSLWLRRVSPEFVPTEPVPLAPAAAVSPRSFPRAVLLKDYSGGDSHARVVVGYSTRSGIATLAIDVPEGDLVNDERNCTCAPTPEEMQGFAIRGTLLALDSQMHSAQVRHDEVPGVFDRGMHVFAVDPAEFPMLQPGRRFLGRVMWRDHAWRLFDVRLLAEPAK